MRKEPRVWRQGMGGGGGGVVKMFFVSFSETISGGGGGHPHSNCYEKHHYDVRWVGFYLWRFAHGKLTLQNLIFINIVCNVFTAQASGKKAKVTSLYFKLPKTQFVNNKWVERNDYFESKQKFILRTAREWKDMLEASWEHFLKHPISKLIAWASSTFPLLPLREQSQI